MKIRLIAIAITLTLMTSFSACNQKSEEVVNEDGKKIINFACIDLNKSDENILNLAAKKFNEENPDYTLVIKDYAKDGYSVDKYINVLNTDFMSGKGPDIISIKNLPAIKYMKKNVFMQLDPLIQQNNIYESDKYFNNIIDACKYNEKLFFIPIHFNFNVIIGSKEILNEEKLEIDDKTWTLNDFAQIASVVTKDLDGDNNVDRYALPRIPIEIVTKLFIRTDGYVDYENMTADFESEKFIELLETLKELYDNKLTHKKLNIGQQIEYRDSKTIVFSGNQINGFKGLLSTKYKLGGGERNLYRLPLSSQDKGTGFNSEMALAINNSSKNKDISWNFLKILLSDEIQTLYSSTNSDSGFPLNKEAYSKQYAKVNGLDWRLEDSGGWVPVRFQEDEINFIHNYVNEIDRYNFLDLRLEKIVIDEIDSLLSKGFLLNTGDAKNVAKSIQKRVRLYLEE